MNSSCPTPAASLFDCVARGNVEDLLEDLLAEIVQRDAIEHLAGVDIHVRFLVGIERAVGGDLDARAPV